jgi:hypothetical protein
MNASALPHSDMKLQPPLSAGSSTCQASQLYFQVDFRAFSVKDIKAIYLPLKTHAFTFHFMYSKYNLPFYICTSSYVGKLLI